MGATWATLSLRPARFFPGDARVTPEQEIWGVALCGEKHHGADGPRHLAEQIGRLALAGEEGGIAMWKKVAARYSDLQCLSSYRTSR